MIVLDENNDGLNLTKDQLDELIKRYYSKEKVDDLIEEFELDVPVSRLVKLFPHEVLENQLCPYCHKAMYKQRPSKTSLVTKHSLPIAYCKYCQHKADSSCYCVHCRERSEERDKIVKSNYRSKILQLRYENHNSIELAGLALKQVIYLIGFCRLAREEDTDLLSPYYFITDELTTTEALTLEAVIMLYNDNLIDVSLTTPIGTVYFSDDEPDGRYHWRHIQWQLKLSDTTRGNIQLLEQLEVMLRDKNLWPDTWKEEVFELWKDFALYESLKFFQVHMVEHGFEFRAGLKTKRVLLDVLEKYSIRQSYYFIWVATRHVASYYLRKDVSKRQASNMAIGDIQRRFERAQAEGWDIRGYSKDSRCGESIMTALASNVMTNLGEVFFNVPPIKTSEVIAKIGI